MTKKDALNVLKTGKAIVRTKLAEGSYFGVKTNDNYTILRKVGESWSQIKESDKIPENEPVIVLTDVQDAKAKVDRTIAVNSEYVNWSIKTAFAFDVDGKGRTSLKLKTFSERELNDLLKG
jgi:hypothetical protein